MHARTASRLAMLLMAAAIVASGRSSQLVASSVTSQHPAVAAGTVCPAGTNWDDAMLSCR